MHRDDKCIFSGVSPTDTFAVTYGKRALLHYHRTAFFDCPSNSCLMIRGLN